MSKTLVDTNILLRLLLQDDPVGIRTAEEFITSSQPASCRVTALVVSEVLYVLHVMGYERGRIAASLISLLGYKQFAIDEQVIQSITMFQSHKLDFVDCYLIRLAISENQDLKTLDKKAQRVYKALLAENRM
jgi:predicted nucleic-acid-binding protein